MNKKTRKEKLWAVCHDALTGILSGILITVGLTLMTSLCVGAIKGFSVSVILNAVRSGLLIGGALLLFVSAGVIVGHGSRDKIGSHERWKMTYQSLGPVSVFLLMAVTVLAFAAVVDYIVWLS